MKLKPVLILLLLGQAVLHAQNPIIRGTYNADPTARVFNGRIYLYPSHDIRDERNPQGMDWFCMADYHVYSSDDLVQWKDHGVILKQEDVPWGNPAGFAMWAPDCVYSNGKYYFYFPDAPASGMGFAVGVAVSDNPSGPFIPQEKPIEGTMGIDPCVLQCSNGDAYLIWSGMGLRGAKLKGNMLEFEEGQIHEVEIPARPGMPDNMPKTMKVAGVPLDTKLPEGFKEGPFAFEKDGKFYLTYPWVRKEGGTEALAYAMSDSPLGPYEFKGLIMEETPGCWTNHHSIVKFKGQWYLFYHNNAYSPEFDKNRSACIDRLYFNEDGTIRQVFPTLRGVGRVRADRPIEADRYSEASNVQTGWLVPDRRFDGWYIRYSGENSWSTFADVDFGQFSPARISLRLRSDKGGKLRILADDAVIGEVEIPGNSGWASCETAVKGEVTGVRTLKFELMDGSIDLDNISFITVRQPQAQPGPNSLSLDMYFVPQTAEPATPDAEGFIRRWSLLDPIDKPNFTNAVFTDSYIRAAFDTLYYKNQKTIVPNDGQKVKVGKKKLSWHCYDSRLFNTKLFRFASETDQKYYGVIFQAVTVVNFPQEMTVRLAVGSNSASQWWIDGREALILSGDRRMVQDDCASGRLTLGAGPHVIRGFVINGPGMSDFCVRFIDMEGRPVTCYTVTNR